MQFPQFNEENLLPLESQSSTLLFTVFRLFPQKPRGMVRRAGIEPANPYGKG